jgi:hypothetical protein
MTKINKREARQLYESGIDVLIGGHDAQGDSATFRASQFKDGRCDCRLASIDNEKRERNFEDIVTYFTWLYCTGEYRRFKYPEYWSA